MQTLFAMAGSIAVQFGESEALGLILPNAGAKHDWPVVFESEPNGDATTAGKEVRVAFLPYMIVVNHVFDIEGECVRVRRAGYELMQSVNDQRGEIYSDRTLLIECPIRAVNDAAVSAHRIFAGENLFRTGIHDRGMYEGDFILVACVLVYLAKIPLASALPQ